MVQVPESEMSVRMEPTISDFDVLLMTIRNFDRNKLKPVMVGLSWFHVI